MTSEVSPRLSVVIPAHNSNLARLRKTLAALSAQTLPAASWETLLVDNASTSLPPPDAYRDVSPSNLRLVSEPRLGLTYARVRGLEEARGTCTVFVDDDNVLDGGYLQNVLRIFESHPGVGAIGGRSIPEFETAPPTWLREFFSLLALRDLGEVELVSAGLQAADANRPAYPTFAPIGAGMALRRPAWQAWVEGRAARTTQFSDRQGDRLTSGGDNDIVICAMRAGWEVGYFPELSLRHLIPAGRLQVDYLARLNRGIQRSWVEVLAAHDMNPWPPVSRAGLAARKARAWIRHRPWNSPQARIRWQGVCGHFEGRFSAGAARGEA